MWAAESTRLAAMKRFLLNDMVLFGTVAAKKHVLQEASFQVEHMSRRIHPVRGHEKVSTQ